MEDTLWQVVLMIMLFLAGVSVGRVTVMKQVIDSKKLYEKHQREYREAIKKVEEYQDAALLSIAETKEAQKKALDQLYDFHNAHGLMTIGSSRARKSLVFSKN